MRVAGLLLVAAVGLSSACDLAALLGPPDDDPTPTRAPVATTATTTPAASTMPTAAEASCARPGAASASAPSTTTAPTAPSGLVPTRTTAVTFHALAFADANEQCPGTRGDPGLSGVVGHTGGRSGSVCDAAKRQAFYADVVADIAADAP